MALPKLFEAAHTLTKDEWLSLGKYLLMYVKKGSDNYRLFEILKKSRLNLSEKEYSEKIRTKYFSEMSPNNYSKLLSILSIWFEYWFSAELLKADAYARELMLNKEYNRRGLFKLANQKFDQLEKLIQGNAVTDEYQQRVLFELYNQTYHSTNPQRKQKELFNKTSKAFIAATKEQALSLQLTLSNRARISIVDDNSADLKSVLESISLPGQDSELSHLLKEALNLFDCDEANTLKFHSLLEKSSLSRVSDLYLILTYYLRISVGRSYSAGKLEDLRLPADFMRMNLAAIDQNPNHKLTYITLVNAIDCISAFESFEEAEKAIEEWIPKTHTKDRESLSRYCQSLNYFKHGRYDELPQLLAGVTYDRIDVRLNGQAMLLIALFETGEEELLLTKMDNLKKQLKRIEDKLAAEFALKLRNLMNFLKLKLLRKYDKTIRIDLSEHVPIQFRSWAEKQVDKETV